MSFLFSLLDHLTYPVIFFLMLVESTVIPFPSEVVVPPAAYHAAGGHLNIWMVWLMATLGADAGAIINYAAGYYLGRPIIYRFANSRWGKLCLISQAKVEQSERYFNEHGMVATITGRLLPGIRQLISVPAGLARMHFGKFLLYTTIGAGAWNAILAVMGYWLHSFVPADQLSAKIAEYSGDIKVVVVGLFALVCVYFLLRKVFHMRSSKA